MKSVIQSMALVFIGVLGFVLNHWTSLSSNGEAGAWHFLSVLFLLLAIVGIIQVFVIKKREKGKKGKKEKGVSR